MPVDACQRCDELFRERVCLSDGVRKNFLRADTCFHNRSLGRRMDDKSVAVGQFLLLDVMDEKNTG